MAGKAVARRRAGRRGRRIGLALAGGGPGGGVYEIGALRALEDSIAGLDLTAMHTYVGVSAGAFVAACLANGLTTAQLARGIVQPDPREHPFSPDVFFTPAYREWARRAARVPGLLLSAFGAMALAPGRHAPADALARLVRALPVAVFDNEPIREYVETIFSFPGRTDDFRALGRRLTVVAADLEAGRPILFGKAGWDHVPISLAVQASTAVPGVYPPVKVEGRFCVDGALLRTLHASVALDDGADLLLCVNPIVPVDVSPALSAARLRRGVVVDAGLPAVMSQTFRTLVHSRMEIGIRRYATLYPHADVVLFEPRRDEYAMFFANIFSFRSRRSVCELAYDATRRDLWERRVALAPVLARHGLRLDVDALRDPDRSVWGADVLPDEEPARAVIGRFEAAVEALVART